MPENMQRERIITADERRRLVPYSHMQIWRMERDGRFPKRIKLGPHRVGWSANEVAEWIEEKKQNRETLRSRHDS